MSTFKKAKVVMLPTNQKAKEGMIYLKPKIGIFNKTSSENHNNNVYDCNPQHLYIISDDEIKEGDWVMIKDDNYIFKSKSNYSTEWKDRCKIIATTDVSLGLPQPSKQFIQKFVEEYNRGNIITDVLIEYEGEALYTEQQHFKGYKDNLKINPKDNTITIKKVKDSWSREEVDRMLDEQASRTTAEMLEKFKDYKSKDEVIDLIIRAVSESHDWSEENNDIHSIGIIEKRFLNKWIEKNL